MRRQAAVECGALLALSLASPCWSQIAGQAGTPGQSGSAASAGATAPGPAGVPAGLLNTASFGVAVGVGETDNVAFAPTNRESQTIATTEVDFGLQRLGTVLDADVSGNLEYLDYLQGAFRRQFLGRLDGLAALQLWSDRFHWLAEDDFGQAPVDAFAPLTPTNLEDVNVFTTGPELVLRPAAATFVRLGARYSLADYENSPFGGYRLIESAAVGQQLSAGSDVTLNTDFQELRFDNTSLNTDYNRQRLYAGYYAQGGRTELAMYLGVARVNESGGWVSSPIAQVALTRRVSPLMSVQLTAGRDYTDWADAFRDLRAGALGGIFVAPLAPLTTDNYVTNYAQLGSTLTGVRTTITISARYERDTYAQAPQFDTHYGNAEINADRKLNTRVSVQVFGSAADTRYAGFEYQDYHVGASLAVRPAEHIEVRLRYSHEKRNASEGQLGFSNNVVFLTVAWRPLPREPVSATGAPRGPVAPLGPASPFGPGSPFGPASPFKYASPFAPSTATGP